MMPKSEKEIKSIVKDVTPVKFIDKNGESSESVYLYSIAKKVIESGLLGLNFNLSTFEAENFNKFVQVTADTIEFMFNEMTSNEFNGYHAVYVPFKEACEKLK